MSSNSTSFLHNNCWLLDQAWASAHMPLIHKMIKGEAVEFGTKRNAEDIEPKMHSHKAGVIYGVSYYSDLSKLPDGSIAMVSIIGPVSKYGYWSYGSVDYAAIINRLAAAPNVAGILLNVDSPGGQASGTAMLADAIKAAREFKPVLGLVNDAIAASAAMWLISACTEIYTTQKTDMVGSVGAYQTIADWYKYYESDGLTVRDIYAPQSTEKNLDYREALNGNDELIQEDLKLLVDDFINTVRVNREGKLTSDEWTKGKMFASKDALRIGLIDGQLPINKILKRLDQLVQKNQSTKSNNIMAFEKTLVTAQAAQFEVVDGGFLLEESQLNHIEAALVAADEKVSSANILVEAANTRITTLEGEVATANTALQTATADLSSVNEQLSTANARITELEALDTHKPAGTVTDADPAASDKTDKKKYLTSFDTMFG